MKTYQLLLSARASWDLTVTAQIAKQAGFDGLELVMGGMLADLPIQRYQTSIVLPIVAVHAPYAMYTAAVFRQALTDVITVAEAVGANVVNIHPPSHLPENGGRQNVIECIRILAQLQTEHPQLHLCYEVLGRSKNEKETYPPHEWLEEVQHFDLPATVDTTHIASWGEDPALWIGKVAGNLQHVHLSDFDPTTGTDHLWLEQGVIDWAAVFTAIRQAPTERLTITLEPSGKRNRLEEHQQLIAANAAFIRKHLGSFFLPR